MQTIFLALRCNQYHEMLAGEREGPHEHSTNEESGVCTPKTRGCRKRLTSLQISREGIRVGTGGDAFIVLGGSQLGYQFQSLKV